MIHMRIALVISFLIYGVSFAQSANEQSVEYFEQKIRPVMESSCFLCHDKGTDLGNISFHDYESTLDLLKDRELWMKVMENLRAGSMPPNPAFRPSNDEYEMIYDFITYDVFGINPQKIDPGRVTLRRLNRVEYRNTIRDLMGVEYDAVAEFPPDDTGYGFDTIGDVLSISPLLLEKYITAAEDIVERAVPKVTKVIHERSYNGYSFRTENGRRNGNIMDFYRPQTVSRTFWAPNPGTYIIEMELEVDGDYAPDAGRCVVVFRADDEVLLREEYRWHDLEYFHYSFETRLEKGEKELSFEVIPLMPQEDKKHKLDFEINHVTIMGPLEEENWVNPSNYDRFFSREEPPETLEEQREYAREILVRFTEKAFRRPVDDNTIDTLVGFAEMQFTRPEISFEEGIGKALVAVLASPRFLFRIEDTLPIEPGETYPLIDEYSLATRLSYFFWSTMPDEELYELAHAGTLRENLPEQVERLLADERSDEFIHHFLGQWLHVRDVEHIPIDVRRSLGLPRRQRGEDRLEFEKSLRIAMRQETEHFFRYIMTEDRSLLEMLDSDYTFLNEELAEHYGIDDVDGRHFRKVDLTEDSPRGGILTQGSVLAVTSNPTRTSPVKRGLFIVENVLGAPVPPPPPIIPGIEEAVERLTTEDRRPTTREILELHRETPSCASCHARFDPLGMSLENFNALGLWRDDEHGQAIDASGELITGERFTNILDIKSILQENHRTEFYRTIAEKMLTYAIGRGMQDTDTYTINQIVHALEENDGRFSVLLDGILASAPFQRMRTVNPEHEYQFGTR